MPVQRGPTCRQWVCTDSYTASRLNSSLLNYRYPSPNCSGCRIHSKTVPTCTYKPTTSHTSSVDACAMAAHIMEFPGDCKFQTLLEVFKKCLCGPYPSVAFPVPLSPPGKESAKSLQVPPTSLPSWSITVPLPCLPFVYKDLILTLMLVLTICLLTI